MERKRDIPMHITPVIPDGYNGPIKQLTCRICRHIFYLTRADYARLAEVSYCHECSLIVAEELEKHQVARSSISPTQTAVHASHPPVPAFAPVPRPPELAIASPRPSIHVPQPRIIDRHKMTVDQLLEEAKVLDKTWRYKEALVSYEQALRSDPGCLSALYGTGEMLRKLNRPQETLTVYEEMLRPDPTPVK